MTYCVVSGSQLRTCERRTATHDISKVGVDGGLNDTGNDSNGVKGAFGKVPVVWQLDRV